MDLLKDKEFNKKLFSLVIPIAFQQLMLNLVSASDSIMLGYVGQNELSAVSLAGQVQFVLSLFLTAITIGTSIFSSQYWGKNDTKAIEIFFGIAFRVVLPVALIFTICTACLPSAIMRLFTKDEVLIMGGARYLFLASPSYLFCGISQIYLCVMKSCGKAKQSTVISSSCVVLDAIMNAILIFGLFGAPKMGIAGASVSTSIARLLEMALVIIATHTKGSVRLKWREINSPNKGFKRDFWKYTTPVLLNELTWGIGFTMYSVIMGHLGSDAVASNSITSIAKNVIVCFCIGLGSGGGIIIGNLLGAGELDKAKEYGDRLCKLSIISGVVSGIALLALSPLLIHFGNLSEQAASYLKWMLVLSSVYMVGKSVNVMTIGGIFCSGGDSKFGFICDTVVMWCITVPLGLISAFVLRLPIPLVYLIINADEFLKLPMVYKHYKKYIWIKDLTKNDY